MKIQIIYGQPVLNIRELDVTTGPNVGKKYGLNRDRNPDRDWSELRHTCMSKAKEVELTEEMRITLLEDLAYAYGSDTKEFNKKLKEFKFI